MTDEANRLTKRQIAEYFCRRLGDKPDSDQWRRDYGRFMTWELKDLREQYRYVRTIHTPTEA